MITWHETNTCTPFLRQEHQDKKIESTKWNTHVNQGQRVQCDHVFWENCKQWRFLACTTHSGSGFTFVGDVFAFAFGVQRTRATEYSSRNVSFKQMFLLAWTSLYFRECSRGRGDPSAGKIRAGVVHGMKISWQQRGKTRTSRNGTGQRDTYLRMISKRSGYMGKGINKQHLEADLLRNQAQVYIWYLLHHQHVSFPPQPLWNNQRAHTHNTRYKWYWHLFLYILWVKSIIYKLKHDAWTVQWMSVPC